MISVPWSNLSASLEHSGMARGPLMMLRWRSSSLQPLYGSLAKSSSKKRTPSDHTSVFEVYCLCLSTWGDMQIGVPTQVRAILPDSPKYLAKPKSQILNTYWWTRMLAALRSRWMMPNLLSSSKPLATWRMMLKAISSLILRVMPNRLRSPPEQYSSMRQMLFCVYMTQQSQTMLGCFSFCMIAISLSRDSLRQRSLQMSFCQTRLMATLRPSSLTASYTFPNEPYPRQWRSFIVQFFIFLIMSILFEQSQHQPQTNRKLLWPNY